MDWNCQHRDAKRAATPYRVRTAALILAIAACAAPTVRAQQYGPNYYYPPNQPMPYYNNAAPNANYPGYAQQPSAGGMMPAPNGYYPGYAQQPPAGAMAPAPYGYYPANRGPAPQQYPRIYGPLTNGPPLAQPYRDSAAPNPLPAVQPNSPQFVAPAPTPVMPRSALPADAAPRQMAAPDFVDTDPPENFAPAVGAALDRPINSATGWLTADYVLSVAKSMQPTTPLVTTSLPGVAHAGSLGQAETAAVYGQQSIDFGLISGVRINAGCFLDADHRFSAETDILWRGTSTPSFFATSDTNGYPIIARPIFNLTDGATRNAAFLTSSPALFAGSTAVRTESALGGIEFNGRYYLSGWDRVRADVLVGFRYLNLSEQTRINDQLTPIARNQLTYLGTVVNSPNSIADQDTFGTTNQLFAGQIGGRVGWDIGRFNLDAFAKLALGATTQHVNIDGSTTLITPSGNQVTSGGILALNSNIGGYNRAVFAVVPELGLNLGVQVTDNVRLRLGYSLLLWNSVARPTGQIDSNVNSGQVPSSPNFGRTTGPSAPAFQFHDEFFWNNFFNVGVEFRY